MLIGSMNYNNNLGFLLTFLLGSILLISTIHTVGNLNGLKILRVEAIPVFAGEKAIFEILIRTPAPQPGIRFHFAGHPASQTLDIRGDHQDNTIRLACKTRERGRFNPGDLIVSTLFPFGCFRSWTRIKNQFECIVYPKPLKGVLKYKPDPAIDGDHGQNTQTTTGNDDFQSLRLYQAGDSLNRISWKTYSQGQGLYTKIFERTAAPSVILDFQSIDTGNLELRISQLCWMILETQKQNTVFGLQLPGKFIQPGSGQDHVKNCLKLLAFYK